MSSWKIMETGNGVRFKLKIQPRSSKNEASGFQGDALKVRLTAPPVDGEANEACIDYIARLLGVPKKAVKIVAGHHNPHKIIEVEGLGKDDVLHIIRARGLDAS